MRLHVVSLPHTQTTKAYSTCAYTEKVRKFATMMKQRGHEVFLYAGDENEADCTELITCITREEQIEFGFNGPADYLNIDFNAAEPWGVFHERVIAGLHDRVQPTDIVCVITGTPTLPIAEAIPNNIVVEFGIGYTGIAHKYRVFESYAWRNYVYGYHRMDGAFYDTVIPNYFDLDDFPVVLDKQDYYLFIGRLNANKGLNIAQEACKRLGKRLLVAGPGEFTGYGEYVGVVGPQERGKLMSEATAVFVPTMYVPPFEGVHIEALLCGTPVITTDFGVFTDTVGNGANGYRCSTLREFMDATENVGKLWPQKIANAARAKYGTATVAAQYEQYFERLATLYGDGWYAGV
jgi:glycosyltransferase involved in cell wall biosynthesis